MRAVSAWLLAPVAGRGAVPGVGAAAWAGVASHVSPQQLPAALWPHQLGCVASTSDVQGAISAKVSSKGGATLQHVLEVSVPGPLGLSPSCL